MQQISRDNIVEQAKSLKIDRKIPALTKQPGIFDRLSHRLGLDGLRMHR